MNISSAPSPVRNVSSKGIISSTFIIITWEPPQEPNGVLQFYEVSYTPNGGQTSVVDVQNNTTWKLTGLKSYTAYTVKVRAKTMAGFGSYSLPSTVSTLEDGTLSGCF